MKKYILSIDQGTTSTKAFLLDRDGNLIGSLPVPITQHYPNPGHVEHDAREIYISVLKTMAYLMQKYSEISGNIDSIAITNQRETTVCFDKYSGMPIAPAIVWQCRRTTEICRRPEYASRESEISQITGLRLDPYFSATKMRWIMENVPGARKKVISGEALFGTIDAFLVYNLTNRKSFKTDYSNCSRTMLFNVTTLKYEDKLLELFDIPKCSLPEPVPSCSDFGEVHFEEDELTLLGLSEEDISALLKYNGISITGVAGDQAAALAGQNCFNEGDTKTTYGTGCFTLMNIGSKPVFSKSGLLTSAAWSYNGKTVYALEGSVFQGGSVISWLKDELELIDNPSDCDNICMSLEDNGGVYLVPAFTGLGAPYWNPDMRGTLTGITRGTKRAHIVRAGVESIAYQVTELVNLMNDDTGITSTHMKVDGGVCASEFLMQLQSDLLGINITRARSDEMTAMGAALLAGRTTGFFESMEDIRKLYKESKTYNPTMSDIDSSKLMHEYKRAVNASLAHAND